MDICLYCGEALPLGCLEHFCDDYCQDAYDEDYQEELDDDEIEQE
jgi:predicted nucleic acid-binding Zn ribbon protein